jgi:thiamine transport system permease protein|tara:strand:+ start:1902 stop:3092 length:1191 start_codon:yes stop_codon:yes gene_type:complete
MDPKLVQAARCLGATRLKAFLGITLPLLTPAIVSAALLVFIFDFTSFGVILILGGPIFSTLEVAIYRQTINFFDLEMAALLSVLQLMCTLVLTVLYTRFTRKTHRPLKTNRLPSIRRQQLNWKTRISVGILIAILIIVLVLPLITLAFSSVFKFEPDRGERENASTGFTLNYYRELFINRRHSIFFVTPIETIIFSLRNAMITMISALAIGLPTTWILARKTKLAQMLEPILMLPLGTSAVTLGLGFLLVFSRAPFNMHTSSLLIPLAHTLVAFPFVVRSLLPSWTIINPQLRKAAAILGANPIQVWREIDLPIIGRAILVAGAFAFTISIGEFGATILLSRPEFTTVPMAIYRYLSLPGALNYGQAMALSTLLMIFCGTSIFFIEAIRPNAISEF